MFDGEEAIRAALSEVLPEIPQQRYAMHMIKNVTERVLNRFDLRAQRTHARFKYKKRIRALITRLKKTNEPQDSPQMQIILLLASLFLQETPPRDIIERTSLEKLKMLLKTLVSTSASMMYVTSSMISNND